MAFKKSSKCQAEWCVEVDLAPPVSPKVSVASPVLVRDSKLPGTAPLLAFSPQAWSAFTGSLA